MFIYIISTSTKTIFRKYLPERHVERHCRYRAQTGYHTFPKRPHNIFGLLFTPRIKRAFSKKTLSQSRPSLFKSFIAPTVHTCLQLVCMTSSIKLNNKRKFCLFCELIHFVFRNNLPMKYDSGQNNHHEYLHQSENNLIKINVSGKEFTTTKETLRFGFSSIICYLTSYYDYLFFIREIIFVTKLSDVTPFTA